MMSALMQTSLQAEPTLTTAQHAQVLHCITCGAVGAGKSTLTTQLLDSAHSTTVRQFNVSDGSANSISALAESGINNNIAIVVLAADTALTDEVRKQCQIVAMLGIKHVVLVINKIDLSESQAQGFENI